MSKKYHTLAVKCPNQLWHPEFGDYDREVVAEEMRDYKDHVGPHCQWEKGTKFKIITTADKAGAVSEAIRKLNGVEG